MENPQLNKSIYVVQKLTSARDLRGVFEGDTRPYEKEQVEFETAYKLYSEIEGGQTLT